MERKAEVNRWSLADHCRFWQAQVAALGAGHNLLPAIRPLRFTGSFPRFTLIWCGFTKLESRRNSISFFL